MPKILSANYRQLVFGGQSIHGIDCFPPHPQINVRDWSLVRFPRGPRRGLPLTGGLVDGVGACLAHGGIASVGGVEKAIQPIITVGPIFRCVKAIDGTDADGKILDELVDHKILSRHALVKIDVGQQLVDELALA